MDKNCLHQEQSCYKFEKIKRLSIKLKEYSGHYISKSKAVKMLKKAKKAHNKVEKKAAKIRNAFVKELMKKMAKDCKVSVEMFKKQLSRERKAREERKMSKSIKERNIRAPVLKATITDPVTNKVRFIETQKELAQAAASNKKTTVHN